MRRGEIYLAKFPFEKPPENAKPQIGSSSQPAAFYWGLSHHSCLQQITLLG